MKKSLIVTSVMSKISLPKTELENDINKHKRLSRGKFRFVNGFLAGFENISWHFVNVPVSGNVEIVLADKRNNKTICHDVPAATGFLAGCTKGNHDSYKLAFAVSLS